MSSPLLSLSGVIILALGMGSSALALALLLAFSSLGYPGMRTAGFATIAEESEGGGSMQVTWHNFEMLRANPQQGAALAVYSKPINATLQAHGTDKPLRLALISRGFFSEFTSHLTAGRDFYPDEEGETDRHVIILSAKLATELFESPSNALEQIVTIDGTPYEVVGAAPSGFHGVFGDTVSAWAPASCLLNLNFHQASTPPSDSSVWKQIAFFYGVAVSNRVSSEELAASLVKVLQLHPNSEAPLHVSQGLTMDPMRDVRIRKWLRLGLLLALTFTVVSSLNYSLLMLARTPRYIEEVRLKRALGANSSQLITELIIGPASMVATGLICAFLLWFGGLVLIAHSQGTYSEVMQGSWLTAFLAFSVQVVLACGLTLLIALIPALYFVRDDGAPRLGYSSTATRRTGLLLQVPVTLQITFCVGTWIVTGMIVSSFLDLIRTPLGYETNHLTVVSLGPGPEGISFTVGGNDPNDGSFPRPSTLKNLLDQVAALPGVRSVSIASNAPFDDMQMATTTIQRGDSASAASRTANITNVSPGYFRTIGSSIVRGRDISQSSLGGVGRELIVNDVLAKELWPNENPLNRTVKLIHDAASGIPSFSEKALIVGVAENIRRTGFAGSPGPEIFSSVYSPGSSNPMPHIVVNGTESAASLDAFARGQVPVLIPGLVVNSTYSVVERAHESLHRDRQRVYYALGGAFLMAVVAYIGLFGTLLYYVGTRRRELALRICLGASSWDIRKLVLLRASWSAAGAVLLSLPAWPMLARLSSDDYLGSIAWSPGRALLIALACASVSIFVSLVPAKMATSVSPSEVLKEL